MKFANLGVFALFASLASALSLSLVSGPNIGIGTVISLNVVLGTTSPGNYAFVLCSGNVVVALLNTVDVLTDEVVSLLLPDDIEPGYYTIDCSPTNDYSNPLAETEPFMCE